MVNLFIRADATVAMGTGHIMRCIALAQAWKKKGGTVTFISHCKNEIILQRIESEGFNFIAIENPCSTSQDLKQTLQVLKKNNSAIYNPGWLILDGYHFTTDYQKAIRDSKTKLLVMDDYHHLDYYCADIIVNQNLKADNYRYNCNQDAVKLLGAKYAMLRSEFLDKKSEKDASEKARKIIVTMGGSDPENATLKIIEALQHIDDLELEIKIVVGSSNPNLKELKNSLQRNPHNIQLLHNADMPELMIWADLAISAGGSTCWELLYYGVPFLVIILAINQEEIAAVLENKSAAINCGHFQSLHPENLARRILSVIHNKTLREQFKTKGSLLIDGFGATRIIQQMENEAFYHAKKNSIRGKNNRQSPPFIHHCRNRSNL